ncbi:MAG: tetratricopeptide repeat protein [Candidatus Paceibacteria bacterium]
MTTKQWIAVVIGVVSVGLIATGVWLSSEKTGEPSALTSTTTPVASTSTPQAGVVVNLPFPINAADTIASWSFKGNYSGNDTLTKQANTDIAFLTNLLGKGKYPDYDLYNGIGNDYASLGDGKTAYAEYDRAIALGPKGDLVYANLAQLMQKLGAYHTAADAYKKAVTVEPGMMAYHVARLTFLTEQFGTDNALILAAFTDASKQFGDAAPILTIEAQWLTSQHRYADAIKAWQKVKALSVGKDTSSIDTEIARIQAKQ